MAPTPFRAAVAALRQRATGPASSRATGLVSSRATGPASSRATEPRMERTFSTGKRLLRGPREICRFNPKKTDADIDAFKKNAQVADRERAELMSAVKALEAKQSKPWFNSTIKGRLLNWPGVIALTLAVGELASRIWGGQ